MVSRSVSRVVGKPRANFFLSRDMRDDAELDVVEGVPGRHFTSELGMECLSLAGRRVNLEQRVAELVGGRPCLGILLDGRTLGLA